MGFIYYPVVIVHVVVCLFLIIVVLLQSGKGSDIAAAFSGQGSQTAFGPRGAATALSRATTWSAVIFMVTSLSLGVLALRQGPKSVFQNEKAPVETTVPKPVVPAQSTPAPSAPSK
jgi:preprotein translocase subunit SecG